MSAARNPRRSPPGESKRPICRHSLQPGQIITVDVRHELQAKGPKMGTYAIAAVMELDRRWAEPSEEEQLYEEMRASIEGDEPSEQAVHKATYHLLWFGGDGVRVREDGARMPFMYPGLAFMGKLAIMGESFLGKDAHGRRIFGDCLSVPVSGEWVPFGPGATGDGLDFPNGSDPVVFQVRIDPDNEHLVQIANSSRGVITVASYAQRIDPAPETAGTFPDTLGSGE